MANTSDKGIRKIVFDKYNGHCAYCGVILNIEKFTIDHIEPKLRKMSYSNRKPGSDLVSNMNPSCQSCNSSKSVFTIDQWRAQIELKYNRLLRDSSTFRLLVRFGIVRKVSNKLKFYFENYG